MKLRIPFNLLRQYGLILVVVNSLVFAEDIPEAPQRVIANHCLDCHSAERSEADVNLDVERIDWTREDTRHFWNRVLDVNQHQIMPPPDELQPSSDDRAELIRWLRRKLLEHTPIGGTLPRRLNRSEYRATIRKLVEFNEFELPLGFPGDSELHGFNNLGEGLVLSPPHLEAYARVAEGIADELFPPPKQTPRPQVWKAGPKDMVLSFSAASVHGNALRLASRSVDIMRSCTWPSRIEMNNSGTYRVTVTASKFVSSRGKAFPSPMILEVYARPVAATDRSKVRDFRLLKEIEVTSERPQVFQFDADIYAGETVLFRWQNADMTHDPPELLPPFQALAESDPRFLAAWTKVVFPTGDIKKPTRVSVLRGRNGWEAAAQLMDDPNLDLTHGDADSELAQALFQTFATKGKTTLADCLCYYYFEYGPSLELHQLEVEGPFKIVDGPRDIKRKQRQQRLFGDEIRKSFGEPVFAEQPILERSVRRFLTKAFRRPVDDETVQQYLDIAKEHWAVGRTFDEGMHLLVRNALISPRFLYRSLGQGRLDEHDLASRLSYFLTGGPPDPELVELATRQRLSLELEEAANRRMPRHATDTFVRDFTGQWLDTALLAEIMPDPKFRFTPYYVDMARSEVEHFFAEMLRENRPISDFIDPDFTYTSPLFAHDVYRIQMDGNKQDAKLGRQLQRIELEKGGKVGGLLGLSAIMMATANGVDTQPVLRGVWMLENILGTPPPKPPNNVPALAPDTRGANSPRERLAAHQSDSACAICHRKIDPIGFVLENFDPVGRWRTHWPASKERIDAMAVLPDGTKVDGVVDLKRWLVEHVDLFAMCLAEKLITYATGRVPNISERHEIEMIVASNKRNGSGFRDLVLALIQSESFRTR